MTSNIRITRHRTHDDTAFYIAERDGRRSTSFGGIFWNRSKGSPPECELRQAFNDYLLGLADEQLREIVDGTMGKLEDLQKKLHASFAPGVPATMKQGGENARDAAPDGWKRGPGKYRCDGTYVVDEYLKAGGVWLHRWRATGPGEKLHVDAAHEVPEDAVPFNILWNEKNPGLGGESETIPVTGGTITFTRGAKE